METFAAAVGTTRDCDVKNAYQVFVLQISLGDPVNIDTPLRRLKRNLPQTLDSEEALKLRLSLALLLNQSAQHIHERVHAAFSLRSCAANPPIESESTWLDGRRSIDELTDCWWGKNQGWLEQHHRFPPVIHAMKSLRESFASDVRMESLAQLVGASRTTLIQQFTSLVGMTPSEYLARIRVRQGLQLLRTTTNSVETIADQVGYQSGNKFYSRISSFTGLRPSQIRRLDEETFERLIEDHLALWVSRPKQLQLGVGQSRSVGATTRSGRRSVFATVAQFQKS